MATCKEVKEIKTLCKLLNIDPFELGVVKEFIFILKEDRSFNRQMKIKILLKTAINNSIEDFDPFKV